MKQHTFNRLWQRGAAGLLLLALGGVVNFGCVALLDYRPDEGLVSSLGPEEAKRKFSETLSLAFDPHVTGSEITDDYYRYQWQQNIYGAYGIPMGSVPGANQVFFNNVEKVEVYQNNKVFVYERGGRLKDQILFSTVDDAKRFADLVMSFRARRLTGTQSGS
jgi:hypothetical protein